jgi:hypothetical protein
MTSGLVAGGAGAVSGKGARRREEIEKLLTHETLTLAEGADIIGDCQRARFLLSDLHLQKLFKKEGRGENATFTRTPAGTAKFNTQPKQLTIASTTKVEEVETES